MQQGRAWALPSTNIRAREAAVEESALAKYSAHFNLTQQDLDRNGAQKGQFQLYCISEVENGRYLVFTLAANSLIEPKTEPDRASAIEWAKKFFYDAEGPEGS